MEGSSVLNLGNKKRNRVVGVSWEEYEDVGEWNGVRTIRNKEKMRLLGKEI